MSRKHKLFHTKPLHDKSMKEPVIRVAPKWLSFERSRAVQDIYGYNSPCKKAPIYDVLQGGETHMNNITDKSAHTDRRRIVAATYAPRNTDKWIEYTEESALALVNQMDRMSRTYRITNFMCFANVDTIGALNTSPPQFAAIFSPYCSCGSLAAPQLRLGEPRAWPFSLGRECVSPL